MRVTCFVVVLPTDFGNFECMFAVDMCCVFVADTCCVRVCAREIERARGWPQDSERQRSAVGEHTVSNCAESRIGVLLPQS